MSSYLETELDAGDKRVFTGWWVPAAIVDLYSEGVINEKELILLVEIDSLSQKKQANGSIIGCYASNETLSKKIHCINKKSVSNMIGRLIALDLLVMDKFDGRKRYLFTKWTYMLKRRVRKIKMSS